VSLSEVRASAALTPPFQATAPSQALARLARSTNGLSGGAETLSYNVSRTKQGEGILKCLLIDQLCDLYSAENQLLKAIPEMAEAANAPDLREALYEASPANTDTHRAPPVGIWITE
jgi:hypothetical protein